MKEESVLNMAGNPLSLRAIARAISMYERYGEVHIIGGIPGAEGEALTSVLRTMVENGDSE